MNIIRLFLISELFLISFVGLFSQDTLKTLKPSDYAVWQTLNTTSIS
ncbi:MAG: hypothetical protein GYA43_13100, partial [Bacteroidales bacterium]|nr:hypothetical protein [Bacteroidales bacterium]